jgi:hypothetical protein
MKANKKYTALELTTAAGFEKVEFGKIRVRIGGIRGISSADHLIRVTPGTTEIEVMVGNEVKPVTFDGDETEEVNE